MYVCIYIYRCYLYLLNTVTLETILSRCIALVHGFLSNGSRYIYIKHIYIYNHFRVEDNFEK